MAVFLERIEVPLGKRAADGCADGVEAWREEPSRRQIAFAVSNLNLLGIRIHLHFAKADVIYSIFVVAACMQRDALCAEREQGASSGRSPVIAPVGSFCHELQLASVEEITFPSVDACSLFRHLLAAPTRIDGRANDIERCLSRHD